MRIPLTPVLALGAAALLAFPGLARAEIVTGECIEWVVADADLVFTGKVVQVKTVNKGGGADEEPFEVATAEVFRTLKGEHNSRVTFLLRNYNRGAAQGWLDDGVPLLFCLVNVDHVRGGANALPQGYDWVIRDEGNNPSAFLLGQPRRHGTYTIDAFTRKYEVLTDPAAITKQAEDYIKSVPPGWKKQAFTVRVPFGREVGKKLYSGSAVFLEVPLDEELERLGRQECQSDSWFGRDEGVHILRHFRSEENIGVLQSLLRDTAASTPVEYRLNAVSQEMALNYCSNVQRVRQLAYEVLQEFGVDAELPRLEEPPYWRIDAADEAAPNEGAAIRWWRVAAWTGGAVLTLALAALLFFRKKRVRNRSADACQ